MTPRDEVVEIAWDDEDILEGQNRALWTFCVRRTRARRLTRITCPFEHPARTRRSSDRGSSCRRDVPLAGSWVLSALLGNWPPPSGRPPIDQRWGNHWHRGRHECERTSTASAERPVPKTSHLDLPLVEE